jgi:hypothetical protein
MIFNEKEVPLFSKHKQKTKWIQTNTKTRPHYSSILLHLTRLSTQNDKY